MLYYERCVAACCTTSALRCNMKYYLAQQRLLGKAAERAERRRARRVEDVLEVVASAGDVDRVVPAYLERLHDARATRHATCAL